MILNKTDNNMFATNPTSSRWVGLIKPGILIMQDVINRHPLNDSFRSKGNKTINTMEKMNKWKKMVNDGYEGLFSSFAFRQLIDNQHLKFILIVFCQMIHVKITPLLSRKHTLFHDLLLFHRLTKKQNKLLLLWLCHKKGGWKNGP